MRVRGWDLRLAAVREELLGEPFGWGRTDCGSIVRRAVADMYGLAPWPLPPEMRPESGAAWYGSLAEARRVYEAMPTSASGSAFEAILVDRWGAEEVGRRFATDGDLLVRPDTEAWEEGSAVVIDRHVFHSRPEQGVILQPWHPEQERSWRAYRLPADAQPWEASLTPAEGVWE